MGMFDEIEFTMPCPICGADEALHHKYLAGLPGADTMRIEVFTDAGWQPLDGGEA